MPYPPILFLHAGAGGVALLAFWSAALLRKGSPRHRLAGRVYLLAMLAVLASALPLAWTLACEGHVAVAAFMAYLVVLTASGLWTAWRAIRDRDDVARYTGAVYVALGALSLAGGAGMLALGIAHGRSLLVGFSLVGVFAGGDMLLKRARRARLGARPQWWRVEHYSSMLGNGIATHIAFLALGLPHLLPAVEGRLLQSLAWFGPLSVAALAKLWLDRRWKRRVAAPAAAQTSPSLAQPSPVPRA